MTAPLSNTASENPYATPVSVGEEAHSQPVGESSTQEHYRRFRRASILLLWVLLAFFLGAGVPMVAGSDHPRIEVAIFSLYCLAPVAGLVGVWRCKTAQQAKLSYQRLRSGAVMARRTCLWSGLCSIGVGLLMRRILPMQFQDNFPLLLVACGIALVFCAFQFPRIPATQLSGPV